MKKILLTLILVFSSCADVVTKIDQQTMVAKPSNKKLNLVFSHNISGETHPCGCRQFPLGGLPQVYGLFNSLKENAELIYVDTGDTFFPSSNIPKSMTSSLSFAANNLAKGLDLIGLKYFVPGDQDFALGIEFLISIANNHKFEFLISNLADENTIKHVRYAVIEKEKTKIYLLGLVNPEAINTKESSLFTNVNDALAEMIPLITKAGFNPNNKNHRLIILTHSGIDLDEKLAANFLNIDWIIGSHSQSFLRFSRDVENVKIVQALSKNHYIGNITIDLLADKSADTYQLHDVRDELEKKIEPNLMRDFINDHKSKMSDLQLKEQSLMSNYDDSKTKVVKKHSTAKNCIECHKPQVSFWQSTLHSLAYSTLMNVKEQNNLQCVKCHSLGLNDPKGFSTVKTIVSFKDRPIIDYWNEAHKLSSNIKSVRKLKSEEIKVVSEKWMKLDQKHKIKNNFANVQCLNCHSKHDEHPFEIEPVKNAEVKSAQMKNQCLTCHTNDQSPEWYNGTVMNEKVVNQKIKKIACPLLQ